MFPRVKRKGYRTILFFSLLVTGLFARFNIFIPSKWNEILESLSSSSEMIHIKLSMVDEEIKNDFIEKEILWEKKLGKRKFYSEEEIQELQGKIEDIRIQGNL